MHRPPIAWVRLVLTAWAIGFVFSLSPLLLGMLSLWRLERRCNLRLSDDWQKLLESAAAKLGLHKKVALLQSPRRAMPMTWGIFRPKLLVPMEASDWPATYKRDVLLHELAHVKRADCLTDLLGRVICSVYWFHPLAWFALLRMRDLRERACDDMVLAAGSDAPQYAEHLLQVANDRAGESICRLRHRNGAAIQLSGARRSHPRRSEEPKSARLLWAP